MAGAFLAAFLILVGAIAASLGAPPIARADETLVAGLPAGAIPVEISGDVAAVRGDLLGVVETGQSSPVGFTLVDATIVVRDGRAAVATDLRPGDAVRLVIDGRTGQVATLRAETAPAGTSLVAGARDAAVLVPLLVLVAAVCFARVRQGARLAATKLDLARPGRAYTLPRRALLDRGCRP